MMDIYDDLDNYNEENNIEVLQSENQDLKSKLQDYEVKLQKLQMDYDKLEAKHKTLLENFSALLRTARAEIERKTQTITQINAEKDQMILRLVNNGNSRGVHLLRKSNNFNNINNIDTGVDLARDSLRASHNAVQKPLENNEKTLQPTKVPSEAIIPKHEVSRDPKNNPNSRNKENQSTAKPMSIGSRRKSMPAFRCEEMAKFSADASDVDDQTDKHIVDTETPKSSAPSSIDDRLRDSRDRDRPSSSNDSHDRPKERYEDRRERDITLRRSRRSRERELMLFKERAYKRSVSGHKVGSPPRDRYNRHKSRDRRSDYRGREDYDRRHEDRRIGKEQPLGDEKHRGDDRHADGDRRRSADKPINDEKQKRIDEERRKSVERRRGDEKRLNDERRIDELRRIDEARHKSEERRRGDEKRLNDERRIDELRRIDEARHKSEERRRGDEKRLNDERRIDELRRMDEEKRKSEARRRDDEKRLNDERRIDELRRMDEEKHRGIEKRLKDERRIHEERRKSADRHRGDEKRLNDERRNNEDNRIGEQRRIDEKRRIEEERRSNEERRKHDERMGVERQSRELREKRIIEEIRLHEERRHLIEQNKPTLHDEDREINAKRRKVENVTDNFSRWGHSYDSPTLPFKSYNLLTSCQSPDEHLVDRPAMSHDIREIKLTAQSKLDDPRFQCNRYVQINDSINKPVLAAKAGMHVDLQVLRWNQVTKPEVKKHVEMPKDLIEPPKEIRLPDLSEQQLNDIYTNIDEDNHDMSIESGQINGDRSEELLFNSALTETVSNLNSNTDTESPHTYDSNVDKKLQKYKIPKKKAIDQDVSTSKGRPLDLLYKHYKALEPAGCEQQKQQDVEKLEKSHKKHAQNTMFREIVEGDLALSDDDLSYGKITVDAEENNISNEKEETQQKNKQQKHRTKTKNNKSKDKNGLKNTHNQEEAQIEKSKDIKAKFSDLFGDSSLITPEDLNLPSEPAEADNCLLAMSENANLVGDNESWSITAVPDDVVIPYVNPTLDKNISSSSKKKIDQKPKKSSPKSDSTPETRVKSIKDSVQNLAKDTEPIINENTITLLSDATVADDNGVIKTVIISSGVQPQNVVSEPMVISPEIQQTVVTKPEAILTEQNHETVLPDIHTALATSTPLREESFKNVSDSNNSNSNQNLSNSLSGSASGPPDLQIIVRRRKRRF